VLPKRVALAGAGLGGMVALELIRRAPDRVARLALMDTSPLAPTPQQAAEFEPRIIKVRTGKLDEVMGEEVSAGDLAPGPQRVAVLAQVAEMARALGPETYVRQARALQRRRDQQGTLRRLAVPVLVLCGALNRRYEVKRHSSMAELVPGARLRVIEEAGLLPTLEQPEAVTEALGDWLALPAVPRPTLAGSLDRGGALAGR
jgi:pimeloyl-ACP methyl ester carboxylesterase